MTTRASLSPETLELIERAKHVMAEAREVVADLHELVARRRRRQSAGRLKTATPPDPPEPE